MPRKPKPKKRGIAKGTRWRWDNKNYVTAYQLASSGHPEHFIARALCVTAAAFRKWKVSDEALADALERGRENNGGLQAKTLREYVYNRLTPELQDVWDELDVWEEAPNGIQRIEAILQENGKVVRQSLFIHALLHGNFNVAEACKKVNISRYILNQWVHLEPEFSALMDEMIECKKDFYEDALVKLVRKGSVPAVLMANRSFNKDRGYGEKIALDVGGSVKHQHVHGVISLEDLDLSVDVRREILKAIREKRQTLEDGYEEPTVLAAEYTRRLENGEEEKD